MIAGCVVEDFLLDKLVVPDTAVLNDLVVECFVSCMRRGNAVYDACPAAATGAYLGIFDVLHLLPSLRIRHRCDFGFRNPAQCSEKLSAISSMAVSQAIPLGGILVQSPFCIAVLFSPEGSCYIFDSHSHGTHGAAICVGRRITDWHTLTQLLMDLVGQINGSHFALLEVCPTVTAAAAAAGAAASL